MQDNDNKPQEAEVKKPRARKPAAKKTTNSQTTKKTPAAKASAANTSSANKPTQRKTVAKSTKPKIESSSTEAQKLTKSNKAKPSSKEVKAEQLKASHSNKVSDEDSTAIELTKSVHLSHKQADLTVTASTHCDISITEKDKQQAEEMAKQHQVLNGRFVLEDIIGVGGMGIVYRATDTIRQTVQKNDCSVAIKILSREVKKHKQALLALQREAYKEQQLSHPNVVKVYDFNRDGDVVYKVMELIHAKHLKEWLKEQRNLNAVNHNDPAYLEQVIYIVNEVAKGLEYVHNQGIVHSDLKPSNIFITESKEIKLFDFGIARTIKTTDFDQKDEDASIFDPTTFAAFTPKYASYEMLTQQPPSASDDIYALGCIMYELLTGHHPYEGKNAKDVLKLEMNYDSIDGLPSHIDQLLIGMLEIKKEDRIQSMTEVLRLLNQQHLPAMSDNHHQQKIIVDSGSLLLNRPFIITLALVFGIININLLYDWLKPSPSKVVAAVEALTDAISPSSTPAINSPEAVPVTPSCNALFSQKDSINGLPCDLELSKGDTQYAIPMIAIDSGTQRYALSQAPLSNQTVEFLGVSVSTEEHEQAQAVHPFNQSSLQTFYIRLVSLYAGLNVATETEISSLYQSKSAEACHHTGLFDVAHYQLMGKGYGEVALNQNNDFVVMYANENNGHCSITSSPLADAKMPLVMRISWKSQN